ncbi:MAG: sulfate adenylyltransferase [Oscillospiraceae bacterium]|nr:sulfate adenylyltransferase [Oscillospiraceae bacterium]
MNGLLKFITCGSVDDGKSTLIGHILYDAKLLYADQEKALLLDSKVGSNAGGIDYSLLLDGLMAEREQGITIDVAYRYFTTERRSFIVADTPGHEEYTRNMAVGASFAELAVILVDASQGILTQTRRHARICSLMGIQHYVFAVNKMDLVGYGEARFREIEAEIRSLAAELQLGSYTVIPLSATAGDNVTLRSENMPWYSGEPLLSYLETVDVSADSSEQFYMPVQRVCRPDRTFRGFQGQIEAGSIAVGDTVRILPGDETAAVQSILITDKPAERAFAGQPVTLTLDREIDISRGCVMTKDPALAAYQTLEVTLLWMDDKPLTAGSDYLLKLGTKTIPAVVTEIRFAVDINTGAHIPAETLGKNSIAQCVLRLSEGIPADRFRLHKALGELILIDRVSNMTAACGVAEEVRDKTGSDAEKAAFTDGILRARGDLFEEFYYDVNSYHVFNAQTINSVYHVGDEIPTEGRSYHYPADFDIIVLRDSIAVTVRGRKITALQRLTDYHYDGTVPVVNGRGFAIQAKTDAELREFAAEYAASDAHTLPELFGRWLKFETFRQIYISGAYI